MSHLPPQVLESLSRLSTEERKIRAQELMGRYGESAEKLEKVANRMRKSWIFNQAKFLAGAVEELQEIMDTGTIKW